MFTISLIFLTIFSSVGASCYEPKAYKCSDEIGLFLCIRAQDKVNSYIDILNSSIPYLDLDCENGTTTTDSSYIISGSQYFSEHLRQQCFYAMRVYDTLKKQNPTVKFHPLHCETLVNSSNKNGLIVFLTLLTFFFFSLLSF